MFPVKNTPSAALYEEASKVLPGGSSRASIYEMRSYVHSGQGCRLLDIDGTTWLDASNNFMVLIHGHRHAPTEEAIRNQLTRGTGFGLPTEGEVRLAQHLCDRVASVERVVFCNSGSEAVMHALKAARANTKRPKIAKCQALYHGSYDFAEVSNAPRVVPGSTEEPRSEVYGPYMAPHVLEDMIVIPFNQTEVAESILRRHGHELAGVLVDMVPSRIGYQVIEKDFLQMLRRVCDELGILLIIDEVASFRVAHGGSQAIHGIRPDLSTFGKVIGGGMPIGAVAGSEAAMRIFDASATKNPLPFTGTFNAHAISMAAGLAALKDFDQEAVTRLNKMGDFVRSSIQGKLIEKGIPAHVKGYASFTALFMSERSGDTYHQVAHRAEELPLVKRFWNAAMDRRLLLDTTARFNLSTAYEMADAEELVEIVVDSLEIAFNDVKTPSVA